MHTKIINPSNRTGKANYDNKSGSANLATYMAKEFGENDRFFDHQRTDYSRSEVRDAIDKNVLGLSKDEEKFHAFIVSPSSDELAFIANDTDKLRSFGIQAMEAYVERFNWIKSEDKKHYGTVLEIGEGLRDPADTKAIPYMVMDVQGKKYTFWGNGLHSESVGKGIAVGDYISIENAGKENVKVPYFNRAGEFNFFQYERQAWNMEKSSPEEMARAKAPSRRQPPLTLDDFVWFAATHKQREYSSADEKLSRKISNLKGVGVTLDQMQDNMKHLLPEGSTGVRPSNSMIKHFYDTGPIKEGMRKEGLHTHIHFIVSARSRGMDKTFHPTYKSGFDRQKFCIDVEERFIKGFGFDKANQTAYKFIYQHMRRKLENIQKKHCLDTSYFNVDELLEAFVKSPNKESFKSNANRLNRMMHKGQFVDNPLEFMTGPAIDLRNREAARTIGNYANKFGNGIPNLINTLVAGKPDMPVLEKGTPSKRRRRNKNRIEKDRGSDQQLGR